MKRVACSKEAGTRRRSRPQFWSVFVPIILTLLVAASLGSQGVASPKVIPEASSPSFTFAAAGDWSWNLQTAHNWQSLNSSGADFVLNLGDMLYNNLTQGFPPTESTWCKDFKGNFTNVEIIVGNHETWESNVTQGGGSINKLLQNCPFTLGSLTGAYGFQYSFDYPSFNPLARFIMVEPGIWNGTSISSELSYANGTATQAWVGNQIDGARTVGIPWVIVGMHKNCITTGGEPCEIGQDFMRFLINKKVDLVLQGHDHNYERSKQLACATEGRYVPSCVANDGSTGSYARGAGTVFVITGTGGAGLDQIVAKNDSPYFAVANGDSYGYSKFTVSSTGIQQRFVRTSTGTFSDSFSIGDFAISASPTSLNSSGNSTITVTSPDGFTGTVSLAWTVTPPTGVTCVPANKCPSAQFSPFNSLKVTPGATNATTLVVTVPHNTQTGTYNITVTGTSGSLFHTVMVRVYVDIPAGFNIFANPTGVTVNANVTGTSTITLVSQGGFTGAVNLTTTISPTGLTCSLNPTTVTLDTSANSTLSCTGSISATYSVTVTGRSASFSNSALVTFSVRDFGIDSPPPLTLTAGLNGTSTVSVRSLNGFSGTVVLTVSANPTPTEFTFSVRPPSVALTPAGTTTATIAVSTTSFTPAGTYLVTLTGTSDLIVHRVFLSVAVNASFSIGANPSSLLATAGSSTSSTVNLSSRGFTGTIDLSTKVTPSTGGITGSFSSTNVTLSPGENVSVVLKISIASSTPAGRYNVTLIGSGGSLSDSIIVTITVRSFSITASPSSLTVNAGATGSSNITVASQNGFTGKVILTVNVNPPGLSCSLSKTSITLGTSDTSTLSCNGSPGTYEVNVTGTSGSLSRTTIVTYTVQDYAFTASPLAVVANVGATGTSSLEVTPFDGFSGTVNLNVVTASGIDCSLTPASLPGSGTSTLSCTSLSASRYLVTVTASSGSLSHDVTVTFSVGDFSISATSPGAVNANQSALSTITLDSTPNFAGTISLAANVSAGLTCESFNPTGVPLNTNATGSATLACSSSTQGTFTVTITGTGSPGTASHSTTVTLTFVDFDIIAEPAVVGPLDPDVMGNSTIMITALSGFAGNIALTVVPTNGLSASLNITVISGSGNTLLEVGAAFGGSYAVTVIGTSGSLSHSVVVSVIVSDFTVAASPVSFNSGSANTQLIVTVASINTFAGSVNITTFSSSSVLTVVGCNPNSVSLTAGETSTASCGLLSSTPGTYSLTITGSSFGVVSGSPLTRSFSVTVRVGDFMMSASGADLNVGQGGVSVTVTISSEFNFAGEVTLTGVATPGDLAVVCPSVVLVANATHVVSCGLSSSTAATYSVTISGRASVGTALHSADSIVHVGDFSVSVISTRDFNIGEAGVYVSVNITSTFNFGGSVAVSSVATPSGLLVSCSPSIVTLKANETQSLTCSLSSTTARTYVVSISGSGSPGTGTHLANVTVHVGNFTLSAPSSVNFNVGQAGVTVSLNVTSTFNFADTVDLSHVSLPLGLIVTCPGAVAGLSANTTQTVSCNLASTTPGTYSLAITGTASVGSATHVASTTVHVGDFVLIALPSDLNVGQTGISVAVTITSTLNFAGSVSLFGSSSSTGLVVTCPSTLLTLGANATQSTSCALSSTIGGTYTVIIIASGSPGTAAHSAGGIVHAGDFTITASGSDLNVGQTGFSVSVTLTSTFNFAGTVSLNSLVNPSIGLAATCPAAPVTLSRNGTTGALCALTATIGGTYIASIIGSGTPGPASHQASLIVHVGDFTVAAEAVVPSTISAASSGTTTVTVTSLYNFKGSVSLAPPALAGLSCSLSTTSLDFSGNASATSQLSCSSTLANDYTVSVSGIAAIGGSSHSSIPVLFHFVDFRVSTLPSSMSANAGVTRPSNVTVTGLNNFEGTVTFTVSVFPTTGITCSALAPVTLPPSTVLSTLSCAATVAGNYTVTIRSTSGTLSHQASLLFAAQDFSVSASPSSLNESVGGTNSSKITASSLNGFSGNVTLSLTPVAGITCTIIPGTVSVVSSATSTLSCSSTSTGVYGITVTAYTGSLSHIVTVTVNVWDFALSAKPLSFVAGLNGSSNVNVVSIGLTGSVHLTASVPSIPGLSASLSLANVSLTSGSTGTSILTVSSSAVTPNGTYALTLTGTSGSLVRSLSVAVTVVADFTISSTPTSVVFPAGSSANSTVTLGSLGFSGQVGLTVTPSSPLLLASLTLGSVQVGVGGGGESTLIMASGTPGTYTVLVVGTSGTLAHSVTLNVLVSDFSISVTPALLAIHVGSSGSSTITLRSDGFAGIVSLFASASSPGLSTTISPSTVVLVPDGTAQSTITISALASTPIMNYTITVTAASGGLSHSVPITVRVQDFGISVAPTSLTIPAGFSDSSNVTLVSINGFEGSVTLSATVSLGGPTVSLVPSSVTLTAGGIGSSTLSLSSVSVVPGNYVVTVSGKAGGSERQTILSVSVVDFSLSTVSATLRIRAGSSNSTVFNLGSINGFVGTVSLSGSVSPAVASGPLASFNPGTVSLSSGGFGDAVLTISTTKFTSAGNYTIVMTGSVPVTGGSLSHSATVLIRVVGDFALYAGPPSLGLSAGSSGTSTITVDSIGLSGTVSLSAMVTPSGPTADFTVPSVQLSPGSSGTSILTVRTTTSVPSGAYNVTVTGTTGALVHSTIVTVNVGANFTITAGTVSPASFDAGRSANATISLNSTGFTGIVALNATVSSTGPVASFSTSSVSLVPGGSTVSILIITTTTSTKAGAYTITVTGTGGTIIRSATTAFTVTGNFTIGIAPTSLTLPAGFNGTSSVTLTSSGLTGEVTFSSLASSSVGTALSPTSVSLVPGGLATATLSVTTTASTLAGVYSVTVIGTSGTLQHQAILTVTVTGNFTISINLGVGSVVAGGTNSTVITINSSGLSGAVSLSAAVSPNLVNAPAPSFNVNPVMVSAGGSAGSTLRVTTTSSTLARTYVVTVRSTLGGITHAANFTLNVNANFTIAASPFSPPSIVAGNSTTSTTISLTSFGLSGSVALTAVVSPPSTGLVSSLSTLAVTLTPGSTGNATLAVSTTPFTPAGKYTLTVTGVFASLSRTVVLSLIVNPDFHLVVSTPPPVVAGGASSSTVAVNSLGLTGTVTFSASFAAGSVGLTGSIVPSSVALTPGATSESTLNIASTASTPGGTYSINVTATGGSVSHSALIVITILPDFALTSSPLTPPSFVAGGSANATITLNSYGLTGTITLTTTVPASAVGLTASLRPSIAGLSAGSSATSSLTITTTRSTPAGTYNISITGEDGSLSHVATLSVIITGDFSITVTSPNPPTFTAGGSAGSTITLTSLGFTGNVTLTASPTVVAGLTGSLSIAKVALIPGASATSSLLTLTTSSTPAGTYDITITGASGSIVHSAVVSVNVMGDFSVISSPPKPSSLVSGGSANSTISVSSAGFTGNVALTVSTPVVAGLSATFSSSSVSLTPGSTGTSTLTISTTPSTPAGTYTVTVTGSGGSITHKANVTVSATADFTITATIPSPPVIVAGGSANSTVSLNSLGLTGSVNLSVSMPIVTGLATSLSSNIVLLVPGSSGAITLTISTTASTPPGSYSLNITGISGLLTAKAAVIITVGSDYSITASSPVPSSFVASGSSGATVTLRSQGFTGNVTLRATVSPSPTGFSVSFNPTILSLTAGSARTSTLTITTTASTPSGTYTITITGTNGQISHTVTVSITVTADFALAATNPSPPSIVAGDLASSTLTLHSLGFSGLVSLSVSTPTAVHLTASMNTSQVSLNPGVTRSALVTIQTSASTPAGSYNITLTGTSGSLSHSVSIILTVTGDFVISAGQPVPASFVAGNSANSTITLTSLGFTGEVTLSGSASSNSGITALFGPLTPSLDPGSSVNSILTVATIASTPSGAYDITVTGTGTGAGLTHTTTLTIIVVPDFILSASSPAPASVVSGGSASSEVTLDSLGLTGSIGLTASVSPSVTGLTFSFSPTNILLTPGTTGASTFAISTTPSTPAGSYVVTITGNSGSTTHNANVSVTVTSDFTATATAATPSSFVAGNSATSTIALGSLGFTGNVSLVAAISPTPAGISFSFSPASVMLIPGMERTSTLIITSTVFTPAGSYAVSITATSGSLSHTVTVSLTVTGDFAITTSTPAPSTFIAGGSTTSTVTLNSSGLSGNVTLTTLFSPSASGFTTLFSPAILGLRPGSTSTSTLTIGTSTSTPAGIYAINVTGVSRLLSHSVVLTITVDGDFSIAASTASPSSFVAGSSSSAMITLNSQGFSGNVGLTGFAPGSPVGFTILFSNPTVGLAPGSTGSSKLTMTTTASTPAGTYTITLIGTSGSLSHNATVSLVVVRDFTMVVAVPSPSSFVAGGSSTSTVTVSSLGLTGNVDLAASVAPSVPGFTMSFTVSSVSLSPGSEGTSTLTITTSASSPAGVYLVTVTGLSGSLSHSFNVTVTVNPEFNVSASAASPTSVVAGGSSTSVISLNSQGFTGNVSLTSTVSPAIAGLSSSLTGDSVALTPGLLGSSTLTITTTESTPSGVYNITVTGRASSLTHTVIVTLTVTADFTVSASPASPDSFVAGGSASSKVALGSLGLTGGIGLSVDVSPSVTGLTVSFSSDNVLMSPGSTGTSTLTVDTTSFIPAGSYSFTITGTSGSITHMATLVITVTPDFALGATGPSQSTFVASGSTTSTITLGSLGFTGNVALTASSVPAATGLTLTFSSNTVSLTPGVSVFSTLTIASATSTPAGSYSITVTGSTGSLSHTVTVSIIVTGDFSITAAVPNPASFVAGDSAKVTLTLNSFGFTGDVSLSASSPFAVGLTTSFGPPIVSLTPGSTGSSIITIQTTAFTPAGSYDILVLAAGDSLVHSVRVSITVTGDFAISSSPASPASFVAGGSTSSAISLDSLGLSGTLHLSVSVSQTTGLTASLSSSSVDVTPGYSGSLNLIVSSTTFTPAGPYTITITASDGSISHTTTVSLTLTADFTVTASPANPPLVVAGNSAASTVRVDSLGLTGDVTLSVSVASSPTGLTTSLENFSVSLTPGGSGSSALAIATTSSTPAGSYTITVVGRFGGLTHSSDVLITVTGDFSISASAPAPVSFVAGGSTASIVTLDSMGLSGSADLSASVSGPAVSGLTSSLSFQSVLLTPGGSSTLTLTIAATASTPSGTYTILITGVSSSVTRTASVVLTVLPDFAINASQATPASFVAGNSAASVFTVSSFGLSGTVSLSAELPELALGASVSFTTNSVGLSPGGSGSSTLTLSTTPATPAGTYSVKVTGTSGSTTHSVTVEITVTGDFSIASSPSTPASFVAGNSAQSAITLESLGFTGSVTLSVSLSSSAPGLTASLNPAGTNLAPGSSGAAVLTIFTSASTPAGTYTATVSGVSGSLTHLTRVTVTVLADFSVTASSATPPIFLAGGNSTSTITLYSFGLTSTVTLTASFSPPATGLAASFSATSIPLSSGGTATSTLTIKTTTATRSGSYAVTVTSNSGGLYRSDTVTFIVGEGFSITSSSPSPASIVAGGSATSTITLYSLGFTGNVLLSATISSTSANGMATSLSPYSVSLTPGKTGLSNLTMTSTPSTPSDSYTITITAVSGSISHVTTVTLIVTSDFSISASLPAPPSFVAGAQSTSTVAVNSIGLSGNVTLTASVPSSATGLTVSFSSQTVSLSPGSSAFSILTISTTASTPSGQYSVALTGVSNALSHPVTVSITVESDFTISAGPASSVLCGSGGAASTITLGSKGLAGSVTLTVSLSPASSTISTSFNPSSVSLFAGGSGIATLTFVPSASTPDGSYVATITARTGTLTHTANVTVTVLGDFTIAASAPSPASFVAGGSATSTILLNSFCLQGSISLAVSVAPTASGLTASSNPTQVSVTFGTTASSMLNIASTASVPAGTYVVIVNATTGTVVHSIAVQVIVTSDFTISASAPSPATFIAGGSAISTVSLSSLGLTSSVSLSVSASSALGLTASLSSTGAGLLPGGSATSTLAITTTSLTPSGIYNITIIGGSASITHTIVVSVTIIGQFTISASPPTPANFVAGGSSSSTITLSSYGFTGNVGLTASIPAVQGLTAVFSSSSVLLAPGSTSALVLTIGTTNSTPAGSYTVTVTGATGGLSHVTSFNIIVGQSFSVTALLPSPSSFVAGGSATSAIFLSSQGFSGSVILSVSVSPVSANGPAGSFSVSSVALTPGGSASSTLMISTSRLTPSGTYTVIVNGTGAGVTQFAAVTIVVTPEFSIVPGAVSPGSFVAGGSATSTIAISSIGLADSVSLTATISPSASGLATIFGPVSVPLQPGATGTSTLTISTAASTPSGPYLLTIVGVSSGLTHSASVMVNVAADFSIAASAATPSTFAVGGSASSKVDLNSLGLTGSIGLDASVSGSPPGLTVLFTPSSLVMTPSSSGSSTLTITSTSSVLAGTYTITISGSVGQLSHSVAVTISITDFSVSASSTSMSIRAGSTGNLTVVLSSVNGFGGTLSLMAVVSSNSLSASLGPSSVGISAGLPGNSILTIASTVAGNYSVTVTGSLGSLSRSVVVSVAVSDFAVSAVGPVSFNSGTTGASTTVTLTSVNTFTGAVSITSSVSSPGLLVTTCTQTVVSLSSGRTVTSVCIFSSSAPGAYAVTVTGTVTSGASLTHSSTIAVQVGDFAIAPLSPVSFNVGQTGASLSVTLVSRFNFAGSVAVTGFANPLGLAISCPGTPVVLSANASQSVSCGLSSTVQGTYSMTISAIGLIGTASHSTETSIHVGDFSVSVVPRVDFNVGREGASLALNVTSTFNFAGSIGISSVTTPAGPLVICSSSVVALAANATQRLSCSVSSNTAGTYTVSVTVSGSPGSASHRGTSIMHVGDFTVSATSPVNFDAGQTGVSINVTLTSTFNFVGSITLTATLPQEVTVTCPGSPVSLSANATRTLSCSLSSTTAGIYSVTISARGSPGTASHSVNPTIQVGDFIIVSTLISPFPVGASGSSSITLSTEDNFSGTLLITASSSFEGINASVTPSIVFISPGKPATSTLSISTSRDLPVGAYSVTLTVYGDVVSHFREIPIVLTPAPVLSLPGPQTVNVGSTLMFVVNASDADASKRVTVTASGLPPGATFSSAFGTGTISGVFSWTPSNDQVQGDYVVKFTADDGNGGVATSQLTIHVGARLNTPGLPIVWQYWFYGLAAAGASIMIPFLVKTLRGTIRRGKLLLS